MTHLMCWHTLKNLTNGRRWCGQQMCLLRRMRTSLPSCANMRIFLGLSQEGPVWPGIGLKWGTMDLFDVLLTKIMDKCLAETLRLGVIQPSSGPRAAPVVLVAKLDKIIWFCVGCWRLNNITTSGTYPMHRVDTL